MAIPITIPRLGWNMEEGTFLGWLKQDGETVRAGELLFRLESEKAAEDIECLDAGILRIVPKGPQEGDTVAVGCVIAFLVEAGEQMPSTEAKPQVAEKVSNQVGEPSPVRGRLSRQGRASPRARRVAVELGIDWTTLQGTGRDGRIREKDVRAATRGKSVPLSSLRKAGVERLIKSARNTVPVTLTTRADVTALVKVRQHTKASVTDLFVKLTALALQKHPLLAARWAEDHLVLPDDAINIGIAVDTDAGLVVPVLHDAAALSLAEIGTRSRDLIERSRSGKLNTRDVQGGVFTITNLGMFGIDAFTPIMNYPEAAILGIGCIRRDEITLSLTFDHRIVDGAPAARFLKDLVKSIESPAALGER